MAFLYAVRMLIPGHDPQPIKAGFSTVPLKRKAVYGSGPYRCEWLGIWPGTMQDELAFHIRFIELHNGLAGEWFLPNDEFMQVITRKIESYQKVLARREAQRQERATRKAAKQAVRQAENLVTEEMRIHAGRVMEEWIGGIH